MSWSVNRIGSKEKVREAVVVELDRAAASYAGKEEEKDVLTAKERILSAIEELDMSPDPYVAGSTSAVQVSANGSRSGYSATISIHVQRVALLI